MLLLLDNQHSPAEKILKQNRLFSGCFICLWVAQRTFSQSVCIFKIRAVPLQERGMVRKKDTWKYVFFRNCVLHHWRSFSHWPWGSTAACILAGYQNQARRTAGIQNAPPIFSITPWWILQSVVHIGSGCIPIKVRGEFPIDFSSATQGLYKTDRTPLYFLLNVKKKNLSTKVFDQKENKHLTDFLITFPPIKRVKLVWNYYTCLNRKHIFFLARHYTIQSMNTEM